MATIANNPNAKLILDFGSDRRIETEVHEDGGIWMVLEQGIPGVDAWLRDVGGQIDLRVQIARQPAGLSVQIDCGANEDISWGGLGRPRITLRLDASAGLAHFDVSGGLVGSEGPDQNLASVPFKPSGPRE